MSNDYFMPAPLNSVHNDDTEGPNVTLDFLAAEMHVSRRTIQRIIKRIGIQPLRSSRKGRTLLTPAMVALIMADELRGADAEKEDAPEIPQR